MHTLATPEAAAYLGIAPSTLNKTRLSGDGPRFVKLGRSVRYRIEDLDQYLNDNVRRSTSDLGQQA